MVRTLAVAVGFFMLVSGSFAQSKEPAKKPNILFVAIDDLNDWIGVLGKHPQARTPNLDRFAKKSLLFTRAYCAAPACNPSRTAILTGIRPSTSGVYHNDQPWRPALPNVETLPAFLLRHGYLVLGGNKIFHGGYPDDKAWSEYFHGKSKVPAKDLPHRGIGGNMQWGPLNAGDDALSDTQMTDWAINKLEQKHDKPLFLAVGYHMPHLPWYAPKKYFDMHPLDKVELPRILPNDLDDVPPPGVKMAKPDGDHKQIVAAGLWKEAVQAYLASCTYMDYQLGRLLDTLESSGQLESTIVILWSDHGWSHGQKQHWRKFALWEQETRVVFMVHVPGMTTPGAVCQRTVNLMDIYPTMIELCQLPPQKGLETRSIVPLLKSPTTAWDYPSITTHGRDNHSLRTEKWRYIRYRDGSEELYDHDNDPLEWKNLARETQYTQVKQQLAALLPKVNAPDADSANPKKKNKKK